MQDLIANPFTPEHEAFRKTVRAFVEKEMTPHAVEWDLAETFPRELYKKMGDLGFLGIRFDPKYGGSGLDFWYTVVFIEELVRSRNAGANMSIMVQTDMATPIIDKVGTDEQKREFLAPAIRGEKIAAIGVSEPDCGSDVANLKTTARKVGDEYVINGSKLWITNGTRADFITLAVRTGGPGYEGISFVLFPTDVKGFQVAKKLKKIGHHASDTALLYFEDCKIPRRYILGEENEGFYHIMTNFQGERLVAAIGCVAGMELMLREAIRYGTERSAFGKPIIKFQVWKHRIVEHLTAVEAARRLVYHACHLFSAGENVTKEVTMAKLFAGDLAQRVAYDCQQMHGGMGYVVETDIARAWRDTRLATIGGGTSEVMKEILTKLEGL